MVEEEEEDNSCLLRRMRGTLTTALISSTSVALPAIRGRLLEEVFSLEEEEEDGEKKVCKEWVPLAASFSFFSFVACRVIFCVTEGRRKI